MTKAWTTTSIVLQAGETLSCDGADSGVGSEAEDGERKVIRPDQDTLNRLTNFDDEVNQEYDRITCQS